MNVSSTKVFRLGILAGAASIALLPAFAVAQVAEPVRDPTAPGTGVQAPEEAEDSLDANRPLVSQGGAAGQADDIVVTGTLVRGIAPPGANVIGVTEADIQATGATTTAQLLQSIPQLGSFNQLQFARSIGTDVTVNRPNLRSLPGFNQFGGSTTLVLMDGHRLVGVGITSTSPDPDIIPPGVLQRLEIVPDGGSAIYGSDAVAGVMNFITRKRFDGVEVTGHYGFADDYHQADVNITAGRDWGSGSLFGSYSYSERGDLFGRDRDFIRSFPNPTTGLLSLQCSPGNVTVGGVNYGLPFTTPPTPPAVANQCDASDTSVLIPNERRHAGYAGLTQQLSDAVSIDLRAFYTNRRSFVTGAPFRAQVTVNRNAATIPFFDPHRIGAETSQTLNFAFGENLPSETSLETWGVTPTITAALGQNWQLGVLGSYSESDTRTRQGALDNTALGRAINAGLINPYEPSASDPGAVSLIRNYQLFARARQRLVDVRTVLDGTLFDLPGGGIKVAFGGEYYAENFHPQTGNNIIPGTENTGTGAIFYNGVQIYNPINRLPALNLSRNVKAVFGEIVVPVFGSDNATSFFQELTISAAGRYDHYSDVGGTFNPKFGLTWKPTDWLKLRGSWGKSFNAPSLADSAAATPNSLFILPPANSPFPPAGAGYPVPAPGQIVVAMRGNAPGIEPQSATTWTLGVDVKPPVLPGLDMALTYYNIELRNGIGLPASGNPNQAYLSFPGIVTLDPDLAFIQARVAEAQVFPFGSTCPEACDVYAFLDFRKNNFGTFRTSGLDMSLAYHQDTGFGSINLGVNANYILTQKQSSGPGLPFQDQLPANFNGRLKLKATAGVEVGRLLSQITLNHTSGYALDPALGFAGTTTSGQSFVAQNRVDAFNVVNLFFRYDFRGEDLLKDLQLTLNIDNVFDQDPPEYRGVQLGGFAGIAPNVNTLGRLVQFGISKKF